MYHVLESPKVHKNNSSSVGHKNSLKPTLLFNPHGMSRLILIWTTLNNNFRNLMWVTTLLYATFVLELILMVTSEFSCHLVP